MVGASRRCVEAARGSQPRVYYAVDSKSGGTRVVAKVLQPDDAAAEADLSTLMADACERLFLAPTRIAKLGHGLVALLFPRLPGETLATVRPPWQDFTAIAAQLIKVRSHVRRL